MKKIKTVYEIDRENDCVRNQLNPGMEWVLTEDGIPTLKIDGTACNVLKGELYKRYDRKLKFEYFIRLQNEPNFKVEEYMFKDVPEGGIPCEEYPDIITGHHPFWVKVRRENPEDKFHIEAWDDLKTPLEDGTYELIGPKIGRNVYKKEKHEFVKHNIELTVPDRSYEGLKEFLTNLDGEGIVFHNKKTGEMAKIRRKDFNLFWSHEDMRKKYKNHQSPRQYKKLGI